MVGNDVDEDEDNLENVGEDIVVKDDNELLDL